MDKTTQKLIESALAVRQRAHAPYSGFLVGAALLSNNGMTHVGCNVENASYGLTICAERSAACSAIAAGQHRWDKLVIASNGGASPCGACRQFLCEFEPNLEILLINVKDPAQFTRVELSILLPSQFSLDDRGSPTVNRPSHQ